MEAKAKKTKKSFLNEVLPVGTVLYRFAKSKSIKFISETIVQVSYFEDLKRSFTLYATDKGSVFDRDYIQGRFFLSHADALRYIAKENNINVQITERVTQS